MLQMAGILKSKIGKVAQKGMGLSTASISKQVPLVFSNFSIAIQEGQVNNKSVEYLVAASIHIFYIFIHVIDDVVFSSAKTHLSTDNLIVAISIRLPSTFLKPSRASGQPISESLKVK
jgi:hypothetical protein